MNNELMYVVLSAIGILNGAQFFYMRSIGLKMDKLSNGCFERHMEIAKKEGQVEMTVKAMHERQDRMENPGG